MAALEVQIQAWHCASDLSRKLAAIPGIGPITASALVASIGDAKHFTDGRQWAAWLGLVPRQHSIHGARLVIRVAEAKVSHAGSWLAGVMHGVTRMWPLWPWRTRMPASFGRFSRRGVTMTRIMGRRYEGAETLPRSLPAMIHHTTATSF